MQHSNLPSLPSASSSFPFHRLRRRFQRGVFLRVLAALVAALHLLPNIGEAQSRNLLERRPDSGVLLPATSVALEQSPFSLSFNPAGMVMAPGGFGYLHEEGADSMAGSRQADGIFLSLGGLSQGDVGGFALGGGIDWVRGPGGSCTQSLPCIRRNSLGLALGSPQLSLGVAWRRLSTKDSALLDDSSLWDLGFVFRPSRHISLGGLVTALNSSSRTSHLLPRLYTLGLGIRPLGQRLTLAADWSVDDERGFDDSTLSWLASLGVLPGLDIVAQVAHPVRHQPGGRDVSAQLALRASLGNLVLRASGATTFGGGLGPAGVVGAELSTTASTSMLKSAKYAHEIDLAEELSGPSALESLLPGRSPLSADTRLALRLQQLIKDPSVGALVLRIRSTSGLGAGRIEELRGLILEMKKRGVPVLAALESGGDSEYLLATAADRIVVAPQALLSLNGLASERFYLRGLLDKVGVQAEFVTAGAYKSAPEQFERRTPSPEAAQNTNWLLDDAFERYVNAISSSRGLEEAEVRRLLNQGLTEAYAAVDSGLVDGLAATRRQLEEEASRLAGRRLQLRRAGPRSKAPDEWGLAPAIGLIEIRGNILPGTAGGSGSAGAEGLARSIQQAADDPRIRALVVRIESPGGDVTASEIIYTALSEARARKPVVVSMGDVAASGGYYVALGADHIVAEPGTLTGSIGVFAGKADISGLMEKVGVSSTRFERGEQALLMSPTRGFSEQERATVQRVVDRFYSVFLDRVAENRKLSREQVEAPAGGRVWTGAQAEELGLVDSLGGLQHAMAVARQKAGLSARTRVSLPSAPGLFELPSLPAPLGALLSTPQQKDWLRNNPLIASLAQSHPELLITLAASSPSVAEGMKDALWLVPLLDGRPLAIMLEPPPGR